MAPLIQLKLDGSETGGTSGQKINDAFVKIDLIADSGDIGGRTYTAGAAYKINDVVGYGGLLYACRVAHVASVWAVDSGNWSDTISDAGTY